VKKWKLLPTAEVMFMKNTVVNNTKKIVENGGVRRTTAKLLKRNF
jgi:hypothetical protein